MSFGWRSQHRRLSHRSVASNPVTVFSHRRRIPPLVERSLCVRSFRYLRIIRAKPLGDSSGILLRCSLDRSLRGVVPALQVHPDCANRHLNPDLLCNEFHDRTPIPFHSENGSLSWSGFPDVITERITHSCTRERSPRQMPAPKSARNQSALALGQISFPLTPGGCFAHADLLCDFSPRHFELLPHTDRLTTYAFHLGHRAAKNVHQSFSSTQYLSKQCIGLPV
jgi:hypothetical protein